MVQRVWGGQAEGEENGSRAYFSYVYNGFFLIIPFSLSLCHSLNMQHQTRLFPWRQIYILCMYTDEADVDTDTHIVSVSISTARKKPAFSAKKNLFCSCFANAAMIFFRSCSGISISICVYRFQWRMNQKNRKIAASSIHSLNRNESLEEFRGAMRYNLD